MLNNVESSYFSIIIFSFIDEKIKLKLVKYNKYLQKYLNVNIINYKEFGGKYIIYESKGKGKEYLGSMDFLLFEGEYLNGERNGRGKEYDYHVNNLTFEGEYLNGKRNGKGKVYYLNKLSFEGEFLKGKKWKGKEFDEDGNVIYDFNYSNDGKMKEYMMVN